MKYLFYTSLCFFICFGNAIAKQSSPVPHSHNGRNHTHPLPVNGLNHNHTGAASSAKQATHNQTRSPENQEPYISKNIPTLKYFYGNILAPLYIEKIKCKIKPYSKMPVRGEFEESSLYSNRLNAWKRGKPSNSPLCKSTDKKIVNLKKLMRSKKIKVKVKIGNSLGRYDIDRKILPMTFYNYVKGFNSEERNKFNKISFNNGITVNINKKTYVALVPMEPGVAKRLKSIQYSLNTEVEAYLTNVSILDRIFKYIDGSYRDVVGDRAMPIIESQMLSGRDSFSYLNSAVYITKIEILFPDTIRVNLF